jgi:trimeric autotransporter adhesin
MRRVDLASWIHEFLILHSKFLICVCALVVSAGAGVAAADHHGRVMFGAVPVPGATVTATRGDERRATVTDQQGGYRFADIADGVWTIRIEMIGFAPASADVTVAADAPVATWELALLPFDEIARSLPPPTPEPVDAPREPIAGRPSGAPAGPAPPSAGFQRAQVNVSAGAAAITADPAAADADRNQAAADGFLINGSVNNGAASPFAQLAAFGNNRRGARSLYNGGFGVVLGNSAWDARPFSFTATPAPKPSYNDVQLLGSFAGPLRIPGVVRNGPTLFVGYQRTVDHSTSTQSALVLTLRERAGDFSQSRDHAGRLVQVVDPVTGVPFAGNVIPQISAQAASLLAYYPAPNLDSGGQFNYQTPTVVTLHQDALQTRFTKVFDNGRNQIYGTVAFQQTTTDASNIFAFVDTTRLSGIDTTINWSHRLSQFHSIRLRYQFTRLTTDVTPYFANRTNVSGDAGITGNNQEPVNWGPPRLVFSSGVAGLASAQAADDHNLTHAAGAETLWTRGRHNITVGGDARRQTWDVLSQQDARGTFAFTGDASGSDLADFLLGLPHTSSIAFGNPDKYLRAPAYDAYVTDDWRVNPVLTVNAGVRWEYEAPIDERFDRLVNLDVAPGFTAAAPVVANDPVGSVTGTRYPDSLMKADWRGIQPRFGLALRPVPGSSLVIRAGYGVYRNTAVYQPIAILLAQQPPLSKAFSIETSPEHPLTMADGFVGVGSNTFAVDPDFRIGYAHNWQVLVQRDLPASLTMTATYLGTAGRNLVQEFLPNTFPLGAVDPCPSCPAGFVYLTSNGHSNRQTGQLQLRRRLRNGLSATLQYALSKATDDAGAFTGVRLDGAAIAQDWLNLDAEEAPSNFDQRHLITGQVQYTTGGGVSGGGMLEGMRGRLFNGWTLTGALVAGSGMPFTPIYLTSVSGTGVTGTIRADVIGATGSVPDGFYANPSAYVAPANGRWGNAGRNSITGPAQFGFDAGIGRSFLWGDRLTLDWRINATNVLNVVTYTNVNAAVGSPQFGLPTVANPMRKLQSTLRMRF